MVADKHRVARDARPVPGGGFAAEGSLRRVTDKEEAYEYARATDRPRLPIERPKVLERPSSTLARSLRFTRALPDRRIRPPLRP
jgi:hypothetical protein